jgi:Mg2+ and Co2+ transporter CorA
MNLNEVFKRIEMALAPNGEEATEVQGASMRLANGVMLEAEAFEAGQNVFLIGEDDEKVPAPVGEHELEDGRMLIITEEGIIAEIREAAAEEAPAEEPAQTELAEEEIVVEAPEEVAPELEQIVEAVVEAVAPAIQEVKEQVEEMKRKFEEYQNKENEEEKVDMSAAAKKLTAAPKEKKVAMQRYGTKAPQNTMGRVFSKLS